MAQGVRSQAFPLDSERTQCIPMEDEAPTDCEAGWTIVTGCQSSAPFRRTDLHPGIGPDCRSSAPFRRTDLHPGIGRLSDLPRSIKHIARCDDAATWRITRSTSDGLLDRPGAFRCVADPLWMFRGNAVRMAPEDSGRRASWRRAHRKPEHKPITEQRRS